ncbi:MAG: FHA domain-containing protein [Oscillibacter sp.]|nr:FHA domain-containing protein [Oscillibacter sp.]
MKGFSNFTAALFGKKKERDPAPQDPVIRFWDGDEPPWTVVLTDTLEPGRCFRHEIGASLLIGFSSEMDISVNYDKSVSRKHCELFREGDLLYITSHSRSNGTYLNRVLVLDRTPISPGDVITMGRVELRLDIE